MTEEFLKAAFQLCLLFWAVVIINLIISAIARIIKDHYDEKEN